MKTEVTNIRSLENTITSIGSSFIVVDLNSRIKIVNRATEEFLGYKKNELIGQPVKTVFEERFEEERLTRCICLKKLVVEGSMSDYRVICLTKKKEKIQCSVSGSVIRDNKGKLVSIVFIVKDMR